MTAGEPILEGLMEPGTTRTDRSQKPNDATAIPRAKAGSNTARLEHDARYGREVVRRLEALMQRHRDGDRIEYSDLVAVAGAAS